MTQDKFNAILASAYNVHVAGTTKAGRVATPSTVNSMGLSRGDKVVLLFSYAEKSELHSALEIAEAINLALAPAVAA